MTNRILRLMVVFALLANQAAICVAHTHHDSETSGHSVMAHVHLSGHSHDNDSHHHHESGHHHHHQSSDQQSSHEFDLELNASFPCDHDDDALFLGNQGSFQKQANRTIAKDFSPVVSSFVARKPQLSKLLLHGQRMHAGSFSAHYCAIYLRTNRLIV